MSEAIRTAEGRHRVYSLLGRLVLRGLDQSTRAIVEALPALNAAVEGEDPEQWAVQHQRVWGFEIYPYQSVFLGDDGLMGGRIAAEVGAAYERAGVAWDGADVEPDHLGVQLAHLAHLCAAERDARVDGVDGAVERALGLQREFLEGQLLGWLPVVLAALDAVGGAFERAVGELIAQVVADHANGLGAVVPAADGDSPALDVEGLLTDPKTGVKRIVEVLLRPAQAGWFLSAAQIGRLAAAADVPAGFGPKVKKLESVVFAAVDQERLPQLLEALEGEVERWRARYEGLAEVGLPTAAWSERLNGTSRLLEQIRTA